MGKADVNDVLVFIEVVAAGSFSAAARKLDVPVSGVSRRVARLERRLGERLLRRTTRKLGLTDLGRVYYDRVADLGARLDAAERALAVTRDVPRGTVRLTAPPDDGGVVWRLLRGFVREHPEVEVEIIHTLEYLDLVDEGIDLALRGGAAPDSTVFTAHALFTSRILLCASPDYLDRRGVPETVDDLVDHACVGMDTWAPNAVRRLDGSPARLTLTNRVRTNRLDTLQSAVVDGIGIGPLLELNVASLLARGTLVEVLRGCLPMESPFWVVYPVAREGTAAAKALVAHLLRVAPSVAAHRGDATSPLER